MRSESALRIQRERTKQGLCRRCGERPYMARGDSDSPYCENCKRKANERQRERVNERKSAGYGPPPLERPAHVHLPHPVDDQRTACGRELTADNIAAGADDVNCSNCRRTVAYRELAAQSAAPAAPTEEFTEAASEPEPELIAEPEPDELPIEDTPGPDPVAPAPERSRRGGILGWLLRRGRP